MTDISRTRFAMAVALALSLARQPNAFGAAQLEGQIRGRLTQAASNAPGPGAPATVSSSSLGDPRIVITNEDGEYLVPNLPLGPYTGTVKHSGRIAQTAFQQLAYDSIDSVQVITGGFDAEYNVFGGIINTITREGSDEWHATVSAYATNASLNNRTPEGLLVTERDRQFNDEAVASTYSYIATGTLGGPIVKPRLWFNATMEVRYSHTRRFLGPPL